MPFGADTPNPQLGSTETIRVDSRTVAGDGPSGHPRVWLHIEGSQTFCPYCSRIYVLNPDAVLDTAH